MDSQETILIELAEAIAAVKAQPSSVRAKQKLADLYLQVNQPEEARRVYTALAEDHVSRDQVAAGAAVFKKMLRVLPLALRGPGYKRLGSLYHLLERGQEAAEQWLLYAERCEAEVLTGEAIWALEQVDGIESLAIPLRIRLAEHYATQENTEAAEKAYEQVLERLEEQAYWSDYTKAANRLLVLAPHHLNTRKMLSRISLEQGEVMESVRHLQQAFRIDRRDPETLEMLSLAFDFLGQEKKALSVLKELADVYEEQEQFARARALYRKILERDPQSKTAVESLTHLQVLSGLKSAEQELTPAAVEEAKSRAPEDDVPLSVIVLSGPQNRYLDEDITTKETKEEAAAASSPVVVQAEMREDEGQEGKSDAGPSEAEKPETALTPANEEAKAAPCQDSAEEPPEFKVLRKELRHCNVPQRLVSTALLRAILQRPVPTGRTLSRWPGKLRRRLDGELLYDDRYLVTDYLGKGLLGKTFRAIDVVDTSRFVCIKRPYFEEFDEEQEAEVTALFLAQATPLLERAHPHLVRVLSAGQTELGYPFLITEYFHGASLAEKSLELAPTAICEIWYRLVHTLLYLQSVGGIHGNLNPKNVLFDAQGSVQICDASLGQLRAELDELSQVSSIHHTQTSMELLPGVDAGTGLRGTRGFLAPELLDGSAPSMASEVFALGCLLYFMVTQTTPPWGQRSDGSELSSPGITRSSLDEAPTLPLGDGAHSTFLRELFPSLVAFDPAERPSLRDIQRKYVELVEEGESLEVEGVANTDAESEVPPSSFQVANTSILRRSPMFRVGPTPQSPSSVASTDSLEAPQSDEILEAPQGEPSQEVLAQADTTEPAEQVTPAEQAEPVSQIVPDLLPGLAVPDTDPVSLVPKTPPTEAPEMLLAPEGSFGVADTVGSSDRGSSDRGSSAELSSVSPDAPDAHPKWSDAPPRETASRLPPLAAPPVVVDQDWVPEQATSTQISLLRVPEEVSPHIQLPSACASLPLATKDRLVQAHHRMKNLALFSGKGDPLLGVEFLQEHVSRLQQFSNFPLRASISYVHTNWHILERHLATQDEVDEIAREASARILKEDPSNLDRAGQIAWSAIAQFTFSKSRLLPFKTAITAVSGIGWSPDQASEWSAAMTAAKAATKQRAHEAGRLAPWNAAKSMAWCAVWPLAKAAAVRAFHPLAHAAAWPISWDASWHTAWLTLQDLPEAELDPFEPLFSVWEMGLYPLQMHDGEILLIILDPRASDQFRLVPVTT